MSLIDKTIEELHRGFLSRDFTAKDVVEEYYRRIEATQDLNAYITLTREHAMRQAEASDTRIQQGSMRPLEGVPVAVKDVFCTRGIRTTNASKMLENFVPSYESTLTQKLWDNGAILLGKANQDEFCMGSMSLSPYTGPCLNPWDKRCTTGGSSGGPAAAVGVKSALLGLGSDTGGSIRQPAAFCGIVGLCPTYGRCSRYGMMAFASSFDQGGAMARTVEDTARMFMSIAGHDPKDATSSRHQLPDPAALAGLEGSLRGKRVGIPQECLENVGGEILEAWLQAQAMLKDAGCEIVPVSIPGMSHSLACYYILTSAEASSNLQRYDGVKYGYRAKDAHTLEELYAKTRGEGFGYEVKRRILLGTHVLSQGYYDAYYGKALALRMAIGEAFSLAFQGVDVLLTPTTPNTAFPVEDAPKDPVTMYLNDLLTVSVNVGKVCALSVPVGLSKKGLPMGMQLIAPPFGEERLFRFGRALEKSAMFSQHLLPSFS